MKTILTNMTVLALLVGLSGCLFPFRDRRDDRRDYRHDDRQDYRRGARYDQGDREQQAGRDCWNRDGHVYCRGD